MSTNPIEERLFLALDTIERLAERAEQSQATIEKLQATVAEQQQTIVTVATNKMTDIDTTYKQTQNVIFQGVYQAITKDISPIIKHQVKTAIDNNISKATAQSVDKLVTKINDAAALIRDTTEEKSKLSSRIVLNASNELDEMTGKMTTFRNTLALKHYGLIALFGAGIFVLMCLGLFLFTKFSMPSAQENQKLQLENNALMNQRQALIHDIQRIRNYQNR